MNMDYISNPKSKAPSSIAKELRIYVKGIQDAIIMEA